jgi:hypothetical protein
MRYQPGQIAIFETARQALSAHGGPIHKVKIYIDQEPLPSAVVHGEAGDADE